MTSPRSGRYRASHLPLVPPRKHSKLKQIPKRLETKSSKKLQPKNLTAPSTTAKPLRPPHPPSTFLLESFSLFPFTTLANLIRLSDDIKILPAPNSITDTVARHIAFPELVNTFVESRVNEDDSCRGVNAWSTMVTVVDKAVSCTCLLYTSPSPRDS